MSQDAPWQTALWALTNFLRAYTWTPETPIAPEVEHPEAGDVYFTTRMRAVHRLRFREHAERAVRCLEEADIPNRLLYVNLCGFLDAARVVEASTSDRVLVTIPPTLLDKLVEQQSPGRKGKTRGRIRRKVAHPLIANHLMKRPYDTAPDVADAVGCSVGVVAESPPWKLNQERLRIANQHGVDPKAIRLNERAVNAAGGSQMTQLHDQRQQTDALDDELDQRDQELFKRIREYEKDHPDAPPQRVASELGCTAGDVERRQATLHRLTAEQADDHKEDIDVEDPDAKRGKRRKWVKKQV